MLTSAAPTATTTSVSSPVSSNTNPHKYVGGYALLILGGAATTYYYFPLPGNAIHVDHTLIDGTECGEVRCTALRLLI